MCDFDIMVSEIDKILGSCDSFHSPSPETLTLLPLIYGSLSINTVKKLENRITPFLVDNRKNKSHCRQDIS